MEFREARERDVEKGVAVKNEEVVAFHGLHRLSYAPARSKRLVFYRVVQDESVVIGPEIILYYFVLVSDRQYRPAYALRQEAVQQETQKRPSVNVRHWFWNVFDNTFESSA